MTPKMQAFAEGIAHGLPNLEAAVAAGYSRTTAHQAASRLLARPDVKKAIKAARKEQAKSSASAEKGKDDEDSSGKMRTDYKDSLEFMHECMNNAKLPAGLRFEAAKQMLPYQHAKIGEKGKKEHKKDAAGEAVQGRFRTKQPPKLHAVK